MMKKLYVYLFVSTGVLVVFTVLFASYFERYSVIANNKMINGDFVEGSLAWNASKYGVSPLTSSVNGVKLSASDGLRRIHISQNVILKNERLVKLSGLLRTTDVISGNRKWKSARLAAVQNRLFQHGEQTDRTVIASQSGTTQWTEISKVIKVWNNTESIDVVFELIHAKGHASIRNISLEEVSENHSFIIVRTSLRIGWLILILSMLLKAVPTFHDVRKHSLVIGVAFVVLTGILVTAETKNGLGAQLTHWIDINSVGQFWFLENQYLPSELFFTAGHLLGFCILTLSTLFQTRTMKISLILCFYLVLFAVCTEIVQLLLENRTASFLDGFTDTIGILAGWLIWKISRGPIRNKQATN